MKKQPYTIWEDYNIPYLWDHYGKGNRVNVVIVDWNFDIKNSGLTYDKKNSFDSMELGFTMLGESVSHGTEMWGIVSAIAPDANIILVRYRAGYNSIDHMHEVFQKIEALQPDILASSIQYPFHSRKVEKWLDDTNIKNIFLASPPSYESQYSEMYSHEKVTVIGAVTRSGEPVLYNLNGNMVSNSNRLLVDDWLLHNHILTTSVGGAKTQIEGTSPLTMVRAGQEACILTR